MDSKNPTECCLLAEAARKLVVPQVKQFVRLHLFILSRSSNDWMTQAHIGVGEFFFFFVLGLQIQMIISSSNAADTEIISTSYVVFPPPMQMAHKINLNNSKFRYFQLWNIINTCTAINQNISLISSHQLQVSKWIGGWIYCQIDE